MLEEIKRTQEVPEGSSDRSFGLLFSAIFAGIALWPVLAGEPVRVWWLAAAFVLLVLSLACPHTLSGLNRGWMRFGLLLNSIVSPVAIGIVYYLTLVPTAAMMRVLGKQPLQLRYDPQATSYWIPRDPPGPEPQSMTDQF